MRQGKVYTSIFDFLIDVLNACGLNIHQITDFLLEKIYGLEEGVQGDIDAFYEKIRNGEIDFNKQNEFTAELEAQLKNIILAMLSSIFSCSAIPVLPNTVFDTPNSNNFRGYSNNALNHLLKANEYEYKTLRVNKHAIDPLGLLDICPTSYEGRLYYASNGQDRYYHKELVSKTEIVTETVTDVEEKEVVVKKYKDVEVYTHQIGVCFIAEGIGDDKSKEHLTWVELLGGNAPKDISITIKYHAYGIDTELTHDFLIPKGYNDDKKALLCSPIPLIGQKSYINEILINGDSSGGIELTSVNDDGEIEKSWVYLNSGGSKEFINFWKENNIESLPWGEENKSTIKEEYEETITVTEDKTYEREVEKEYFVHEYVECSAEDVPVEDAVRLNNRPEGEIDLAAPEYAVYYDGLNPNTLYQTYDMNAFLWYALHKGMKIPQVEYNHLMWDSRVSARKNGVTRKNASEWNKWYNSKETYNDEFKWLDEAITKNSPLFPILQVEPQGTANNFLFLRIPSQRYFLPDVRENNLKEESEKRKIHIATNATMYRYNREYLNNIQLLNPKILLVGLCECLLGFSLSTLSSTRINLTRKLIETKLSKAIKTIIEANDMETEDCYMEFSNDEVNEMMEEMLLARYNATTYGGETATVKTHDTQKYIAMLDQVNPYTSQEGNMGMIKKIVTEVTADPMTEGSIDYGLQIKTDGNLLKKLLWAIVMPIIMSIFTPQLLLLIYMNFTMMGVIKIDETMGQDFSKILNYLMNKIFSLLKSIIIYVKDRIVLLLLELFYEAILPLLLKYELLIIMERLQDWLRILKSALLSLPSFRLNFTRNKIYGAIEDVNYADIESTQNTPESTSTC
jgi:hypothetical protein